jgi:hypothetical protein
MSPKREAGVQRQKKGALVLGLPHLRNLIKLLDIRAHTGNPIISKIHVNQI